MQDLSNLTIFHVKDLIPGDLIMWDKWTMSNVERKSGLRFFVINASTSNALVDVLDSDGDFRVVPVSPPLGIIRRKM